MSACCRFGDRLTALVDGELGHAERDRILVHLTSCPDCRADVAAQRRLKRRLAHAETPDPSADLSRRLLALAEPGGPLPPARPHAPQGALRAPYTCPPGRAPARRPPARASRRGRARRLAGPRATEPGPGRTGVRVGTLAAGALSVVVVALGTAFLVGGSSGGSGPVVRPAVERYAVEHAATVSGVPFSEPAFGAVSARVTMPAGPPNSTVEPRRDLVGATTAPASPQASPSPSP